MATQTALAELAAERAFLSDIRALARRIAADQRQVGGDLRVIAAGRGLELGEVIDGTTAQALSQLRGPRFDRAYMKAMVTAQKAALRECMQQANAGGDRQISAWAAKAAWHMQAHLHTAGEIRDRVAALGFETGFDD